MIEQVRRDLTRGLKKAEAGRSGLTPRQILRSLVLMRIKNWNYRELRERIADGCTLRQFADFYCLPVPRHDALFTAASIGSRPRRSRRSMIWWCRRQSGSGWRTAKSCASTPRWCRPTFIIRPTTRCCGMVVRVVTRLIGRLAAALGRRRIKGFCDRTRAARRRMLAIQRMTHDATASPAERKIPRAHRHYRAGRGKRTKGS